MLEEKKKIARELKLLGPRACFRCPVPFLILVSPLAPRVLTSQEAGGAMSLRPSERAELRRSDFKASAVEGEAGRQRRENMTVEIRKASRDSALWMRRQEAPAEGMEAGVALHEPLAIIDRNRMVSSSPGFLPNPIWCLCVHQSSELCFIS
jgi:hypothetical protein